MLALYAMFVMLVLFSISSKVRFSYSELLESYSIIETSQVRSFLSEEKNDREVFEFAIGKSSDSRLEFPD